MAGPPRDRFARLAACGSPRPGPASAVDDVPRQPDLGAAAPSCASARPRSEDVGSYLDDGTVTGNVHQTSGDPTFLAGFDCHDAMLAFGDCSGKVACGPGCKFDVTGCSCTCGTDFDCGWPVDCSTFVAACLPTAAARTGSA